MPPKKGSLRKKGKYFYYTFYHNNIRICDMATGETSERKASKVADDIYINYAKKNKPSEGLTCEEFFKDYINRYNLKDLSAATKYETELILLTHFAPVIGSISLVDLKLHHIEDYYLKATQSNNTLAKHHRILKRVLADAVKRQYIPSNPANDADAPTVHKSNVGKSLTAKQARDYLNHLKLQKNEPRRHFNEQFYICAILALLGGLRREEVVGLKWDHVLFTEVDAQEFVLLKIDQAITTVAGKVEIGSTKTTNSTREVFLPPSVTADIKKHRKKHLENKMRLGDLHTGNYVICYDNGEYVEPNLITRTNKYLLNKYNLPNVRYHDLRHSHASLLLAMGIDLKVISARLGHSNIHITADVYTHVDTSLDINAASVFSDILVKDS